MPAPENKMATDQPQKLLKAQTLKGFRDYMPELMAPRQAMIRLIEATFERHGFQPLQTPALEYLETLAGKYGEEGDKLLYRFQDHGERHVALRYDLTVPLARVVAEHRNEIQLPFRRYHVAPVWRADKPQRGRFREFFQCDADIVGVNSAMADAETLITGLSVLQALGIEGAVLHLNHRDILFGTLERAGVSEKAQQIACIRAIDKLDKVPAEVVQAEIEREAGVDAATATKLIGHFTRDLDGQELLSELKLLGGVVGAAVDRVVEVRKLVEAAGFVGRIKYDPTIARGLDYYTGIIYETRLTDPRVKGIGAVMSGGRYDGLIGLFTKEAIPAVGISLGLDRLLAAMQELDLVQKDAHAVQVYVTVASEALQANAIELAHLLRLGGMRVELDLAGGKLGKQLERANKRGVSLAAIVMQEDVDIGKVRIRQLATGKQQRVALQRIVKVARSALRLQSHA